MRLLVAIIDTVAKDIIGPVQLFRHEQAAIRMFADVAAAKEPNAINTHLRDHELWILGHLADETLTIIDTKEHMLLSGEQLAALSQPEN